MSDEILFYHNPQSRGRVVHWMLEEVGANYKIQRLDFKTGEHKKPDFLAINPMGKIPAIVHKGTVVTEVPAICAYLADVFPQSKLAPTIESPLRGSYYRWLFFGAGCIEPAVMDKQYPRQPAPPIGVVGYGTYADALGVLENELKKKAFLVGDAFTAADLCMSSQLGWGLFSKSIDERPAFRAYVERCEARPAYQRFLKKTAELEADHSKRP